jgi:glutamate-1-semialdehyde 2,1-aminomutase
MNPTASREWAARAAEVIPGGASTLSKSPAAFPGDFPGFLRSGYGSRVLDVDGNLYTDWICGLGAVGLGYREDVIFPAAEQLARGVSFSLPTTLGVEVAEALTTLIPCADMVRFTKTGSEACAGAVRLARDYTRRPVIVVCGYHGWHDWYAASLPLHPGVPNTLEPLVRTFQYNDYTSLLAVMGPDVAAIIMEPVLHEKPNGGFLDAVYRVAKTWGSLLIFDENVTGFRVDLRGAQHYYGVIPDLAVVGKAMSNGFPLAAVVGRREIMQNAEYISGTFGGETVSLAAAKATINVYRTTGCIPRMHGVGLSLLRQLREALLPEFRVDGLPWKPRIGCADDRRLAGLVEGLARRGHLIHPRGFYVSCAHTEADVTDFVRAATEAQLDPWEHVVPPRGVSWLRA